MQFGQQRGDGLNLRPMTQQQSSILRVTEVPRQQRESHAKLRNFRTAHVVYALAVYEIGEVVIDDSARHGEAPPLKIGVDAHGEDVLEAVVFRSVVISVYGAILGVDAARANHELFGKGVFTNVEPIALRNRSSREVAEQFLPIDSKQQ